MIALVLATILTGAFGIVVRFGQKRNGDLYTIGVVNYAVASLVFLPILKLHPPPTISSHTVLVGVFGGVLYATAYYLFLPVLRSRGVAIGTAVARVSVLMPMLLSLLVWHEAPSPLRAVGALLAFAALPLLAMGRLEGTPRQPPSRELLVLAALFISNGACLCVSKWYHATGTVLERPAYFMVLFGVAALYTGTAWVLCSRRVDPADLATGVVLGVMNAFANFALLSALDAFSGVVVFPVTAAGGLVFAVLFAALWWRELPSRWGALGVVLAVLAVVLVNL
jgi:drug/metabolite transporter (DMT)-like permease